MLAAFAWKEVLELIHTDLCGPINVPSMVGNRYILIFVDDFSRYCVTYLLKDKSEIHNLLRKFVAKVKNKFERKPQAFQSDSSGEYISNHRQTFLEEQGILNRRTVPYTPEQNGIAERKLRSLLEMTRCMLADAELPNKLWDDVVMTATYLQNRLPTKGTTKAPFEIWHGRIPNI